MKPSHLTGRARLYSSGPVSRVGSSLEAPSLQRKDKAVAPGIELVSFFLLEPQCSGHFQVSDVVDGSVEGSVTLSGTGEGKISGGAAVSDSSSASMNVRILLVTQNTWETMQRDR